MSRARKPAGIDARAWFAAQSFHAGVNVYEKATTPVEVLPKPCTHSTTIINTSNQERCPTCGAVADDFGLSLPVQP